MSISFGLGSNLTTSLSTSQKLTPQMQQAIKLLQMSSVELEQEVQMKLDSNPLLERVEEETINADDFDSVEELTRLESDSDFVHDDGYNDKYDNDKYEHAYDEPFETNADKDIYASSTALSRDDPQGHNTELNGSENSEPLNSDLKDLSTDNNFDTDPLMELSDLKSSSDKVQSNLDSDSLESNYLESDFQYNDKQYNDKQDSNQQDVKDTSENMAENTLGEYEIDTNWDEVYTHAPTGLASRDFDDIDDYQGATSVNLQDHIRWQLNFKHLSNIDILIANYLIDAMDESGFIRIEIDELKQNFDTMSSFYQWDEKIDYEQIEMMFHVIQSCEPLGVGARNLAECLQIQLRKLPEKTPYRNLAINLLDKYEYLVSNNIKALIKETGVKRNEISDCLALIRKLNPSPGTAFLNTQSSYGTILAGYDVPDVLVSMVQQDDNSAPIWQVKLNPDTLPKLKINKEYANLVKRGDDSPDNVYLRDNLTDARLFIRSIEERNQNLLKVATRIVERQQDFLLQGPTAMKPLILKDIAEAVDLHESTVSRLTTSKSILTPKGLFPLKYFFSSHVSSSEGDVSSTAICAMIQHLIDSEDPKKPLSDRAIQEYLENEGIDIARRTVSKYREAMNIGSSTQRKIKF